MDCGVGYRSMVSHKRLLCGSIERYVLERI